MKDEIEEILKVLSALKAKEIAKKLGKTRTEINQILYMYPDIFMKQAGDVWVLAGENELKLEAGWVTAQSFERSLAGSGHREMAAAKSLKVIFPDKCQIMLDAAARLLALMNQLAGQGKDVAIDFSQSIMTRNYLNRAGFFDLLHPDVEVLPGRPRYSAATSRRGNSQKLVEFDLIDPANVDTEIPARLRDCFVGLTSAKYRGAAFTIFGELCSNVCRHSETKTPGFAALQKYTGRSPHIQTVVSDNGLGIATTLKKGLEQHYPELFKTLDLSCTDTDATLIEKAFREGRLSQYGPENGAGLHASNEAAVKYSAEISVRQSTFQLMLDYRNGILVEAKRELNLPEIGGTHVCFDFSLTNL